MFFRRNSSGRLEYVNVSDGIFASPGRGYNSWFLGGVPVSAGAMERLV